MEGIAWAPGWAAGRLGEAAQQWGSCWSCLGHSDVGETVTGPRAPPGVPDACPLSHFRTDAGGHPDPGAGGHPGLGTAAGAAASDPQKLGRGPIPRERTFPPTGLPTLHLSPPDSSRVLAGTLPRQPDASNCVAIICLLPTPKEPEQHPRASELCRPGSELPGKEMGPSATSPRATRGVE